jgi:hypothetical protein
MNVGDMFSGFVYIYVQRNASTSKRQSDFESKEYGICEWIMCIEQW